MGANRGRICWGCRLLEAVLCTHTSQLDPIGPTQLVQPFVSNARLVRLDILHMHDWRVRFRVDVVGQLHTSLTRFQLCWTGTLSGSALAMAFVLRWWCCVACASWVPYVLGVREL